MNNMNKFIPVNITHISPTKLDIFRNCMLQVAFDNDVSLQALIIKGTSSHLGTICHRVLEAVSKFGLSSNEDWDLGFERIWQREVAKQEQFINNHPYERHLGQARYWRSYAMRRARIKKLARAIWLRQQLYVKKQISLSAQPTFERKYVAFDGKLIGIADVVRMENGNWVIEDYKTGTIISVDDETGETMVKINYVHQVHLYAAMHHNTTGKWPTLARIIPIEGDIVEIPIDQQLAINLADEAIELLNTYRKIIKDGGNQEDLAHPSSTICRWCSYHGICNPFWTAIQDNWEWYHHAVEGTVSNFIRSTASSGTVVIEVNQGSIPIGNYPLHLKAQVYVDLVSQLIGQKIRITWLEKKNQALWTTERSMIFTTS